MKIDEFGHIDNLIKQIQIKMGWDKERDLSQRDFEFLIESVYLKTKTRVSLSTVKRIWSHENQYLPRVTTLDILSQYLGYSNWSHFKVEALNLKPKQKLDIDFTPQKNRKFWKIAWMSIGGIIIALLFIYFGRIVFSGNSDEFESIEFSVDKIVGDNVPATVVFSYDVSKLEFDSAFIQLSWNKLERHRISTDQNLLTSTYYMPGIHEAKLIINDSIVRTQTVYIENDSWLALFRNEPNDVVPIYINSEKVYKDGYIHANTDLLAEFRADTARDSYYVSYILSKDFGINGDEFSFETRMKNPSTKGKFSCQSSSIYLYAENGGIFMTFNKPGCVGNTSVIIGDKIVSGRRNDLSSLGMDFGQWQEIKGIVKDKQLNLFINDTLVYRTDYEMEIGKVLTCQYFFMGTGAVDNLVLSDNHGNMAFKEDF